VGALNVKFQLSVSFLSFFIFRRRNKKRKNIEEKRKRKKRKNIEEKRKRKKRKKRKKRENVKDSTALAHTESVAGI